MKTRADTSSGAGVPSSTPSQLGEIYVDTTNEDVYMAKGTASSADWVQVDASASAATWGTITGTLSSQTDLQSALDGKVDDSQVLTDVPAGAVFTDTVYDDTAIQAEVDLNTAKTGVTTQISNVVEDTTPQAGGEFDFQANSAGFTTQIITGDGTTTFDLTAGNKIEFTFGAQNETFTFTAPTKDGSFIFVLIGIPIAIKTHRREKSINFGLTMLLFLVYWGIMLGGVACAIRDIIPPWLGIWMANGFVFVIGVILFARLSGK